MSFLKSVVRGAGSELGRSAMRAVVVNPLFNGKDARSVSVSSQGVDSSKVTVLEADVIQIGSKNNSGLNWFLSIFWGFAMSLGLLGVGFLISNAILAPRKIMKLDQSYYKADGRTKSGFRVNENASVVDVQVVEVSKDQKTLAAIHKGLAYVNLGITALSIVILIATYFIK